MVRVCYLGKVKGGGTGSGLNVAAGWSLCG